MALEYLFACHGASGLPVVDAYKKVSKTFPSVSFFSPQQPVVPCEEAQTVLVVKHYISGLRDWNSLSMTEEFVHFY
jgi:hypothetical protein